MLRVFSRAIAPGPPPGGKRRGETIMTPSVRGSLVTLIAAACLIVAAGAKAQSAAGTTAAHSSDAPKWMQRWMDDREAMLDARLAGLKAGLQLTPDQEKLWGPFEAAVRDFAQMRTKHMQGMMERTEKMGEDGGEGSAMSPIDRLDRIANRLTTAGAALRGIADAAKPLYASLDDQQKRRFGFLSHEMMMMGHRGGHMDWMMGPDHHHDDAEDDDSDE
jgi:hypothetical protein